jgi:hypothetical protein
VIAAPPEEKTVVTLEGSVAPLPDTPTDQAGLPAVIETKPTPEPDHESDQDKLMAQMTPQEAAAEITMLAGLSAEDTGV